MLFYNSVWRSLKKKRLLNSSIYRYPSKKVLWLNLILSSYAGQALCRQVFFKQLYLCQFYAAILNPTILDIT